MRASMLRLALIGSVALVGAGCESMEKGGEEHVDVTSAVRAVNDAFEQGWAAGDAAAMAGLYTADAMLLPPNSAMVQGREAVGQLWTGFLAAGAGTVKLTTLEALGDEDLAHEVGTYVVNDAAGTVVDRGKYIVIWRHGPDGWRIHRDIWNSDNPPAPAPPAGS